MKQIKLDNSFELFDSPEEGLELLWYETYLINSKYYEILMQLTNFRVSYEK